MNYLLKRRVLVIILFSLSLSAYANPARKSPPFQSLQHPIVDTDVGAPSASDPASVLNQFEPVQDQGDRGTCTIFTSTALIEAMLTRAGVAHPKLSEEWLEYLVTRTQSDDGSTSARNLEVASTMGMVSAQDLPYVGDDWEGNPNLRSASQRCGSVPRPFLKNCLIGHMDPRLANASDLALISPGAPLYDPGFEKLKQSSIGFRDRFMSHVIRQFRIASVSEAKALLRAGIPISLDLDFFDGAWNHPDASSEGMTRDLRNWALGVVGYPEPGSVDRARRVSDGHSVVVFGYDDNATITARETMRNGSEQEFTYRGVYYFRNSWGTQTFGRDFSIAGHPLPGNGVLPQKYAHDFGSFYQLRAQ